MAMKSHELKQKRTALKAELSGMVAKSVADDTDFTEDQESEFVALEAKVKDIDAKIEASEKRELRAAQYAAAPSVPASPISVKDKTQGGFENLAEFAIATRAHAIGNATDQRLIQTPTNSHQETNSDDGFMVPDQFRDDIWELITAGDGFVNDITTEDTAGNNVGFLRDESTPWGALGISASWTGELQAKTPSRLNTDKDMLVLKKLSVFAEASDELLEDAPRLVGRLTKGAADAITFKLDESIFDGDGVGKPEGFMNSGALISVAKEGSQSADTIVAANVLKMYSRQWDVTNSQWLVNSDTIPQLAQMTIGDQPVYIPPSGLAAAPHGMLLGRPIRMNNQSNTLGSQGDIVFAAMKGYYGIKKAGGVNFAQSMHLFFDRDAQAFRWTFRFNGQTFMSKPITPNKGATKSMFVTLDERA